MRLKVSFFLKGKKSFEPSTTHGTDGNSTKSNLQLKNKSKLSNPIKYSEVSEDSSDDEDFRPVNNVKITNKNNAKKRDSNQITSAMSRDTPRSISSSTHSIGKYF